ncbi:AAA family ATPase [Bosea sp. TAB14]|uniref:AAA family ATPase n=1 Tax=Bosea sp. TAB14 TaxID=3237481 RepID=UPI003F92C863
MTRNPRPNRPPPAPLPAVAIIAQDKGGEGKSLTALALADRAQLSSVPIGIVQVDDQGRLPLLLGPDVVTIRIDPRLARRDPSAELRAFTPLYETIEQTSTVGGLTIIEFGANMASRGALWAGMVDLDEELREMGTTPLIITPVGATAESLRLGARAAHAFLDKLPTARIALIENERDGLIQKLHPASDAAAAYRDEIVPLMAGATVLRMPLVEGASWRVFEAAGVRPVDVVSMAVSDIMALTGLPKPEAKIARGDIAAWTSVVCDEFDKLIRFDREAGDDA